MKACREPARVAALSFRLPWRLGLGGGDWCSRQPVGHTRRSHDARPADPVTPTSPSSAEEPAWHSQEQEARLLAELLRTSRLALLYGQPGSDKTALLKNDLM